MYDIIYLLGIRPNDNVQRDIGSTPLAIDEPSDGYRNPETGQQDSNIDDDSGDIGGVTAPNISAYLSPPQERDTDIEASQYELHDRAHDLREQDYYERLELTRDIDREWDAYYEGGFHDFNYGP
jgi:hypothetical protein